ncbi:hypothetical protein [Faecalispora sporosphaeroides]|uniref:hypothetical protein n=1 Tax=Faecalispora sporosphaeroides TaxID=1549 RepID=UPI00035EC023|nr:hypothetical protein [Faecalispora sporosphaeroides]
MLRSCLYEDYKAKLLDEAEYLFAKSRYEEEEGALQSCLDELFAQKHRLEATPQKPWPAALKKWRKSKTITTEMAAELIERVEIYGDKTVSICFRYRDEFENLLRQIEADGKAGSI